MDIVLVQQLLRQPRTRLHRKQSCLASLVLALLHSRAWCRGIPSEQWAYKALRAGPGNTEERLTVKLFFSSPEWHFAKSTGHRTLQRVMVSGHTDDKVTNTSTVRCHMSRIVYAIQLRMCLVVLTGWWL